MIVPEFFKFNSLISVPLFSAIAFLLIRKAEGFSFRKHTISMSVNLLNRQTLSFIFRSNFFLKAILDLGFHLYVINYFKIPIFSPVAMSLILSAVLFGLLAIFIEGKYSFIHKLIIYSSGILWATAQFFIVKFLKDNNFILFTYIAVSIPVFLGLGFLFVKKTNVLIQIICLSIWYVWLILFVFKYL